MEDFNLHLTGDVHAIGAAHNLAGAFLDNSLHHKNPLGIDPRGILWPRVVDISDRALRHVVIGLGGREDGVARETEFVITVGSEVMAVLALATDLNEFTHFVAKPVRGHGNVTGADNVVSWQTGYPFGVNFSRGFPRFNPGEFTTVDTLSRGDADAAMIIASDPASNFPKAAIAHLHRIPVISLDTKTTITSSLARVAFRTSTYGINTGGTVYRMDDVPITLRKAFDSPFPDDETILRALLAKVRELLQARMPRGAKSAFELPLSA